MVSGQQSQFASSCGFRNMAVDECDFNANNVQDSGHVELQSQSHSNCQISCMQARERPLSVSVQLEEKWYRSPEQLNKGSGTFSSNIYSLGVLLFEVNIECFM